MAIEKKIVLIFLVLTLLVACDSQVSPAEQSRGNIPKIEISVPTPLPEKPQYEPPPSPPEVQEVQEIDAREMEFLPAEVKVKKGDYVRLVLTARDIDQHFYIDAYGIDEPLPLGKDVIIEFRADKTGKFIYRSKVIGMEGMLIVR